MQIDLCIGCKMVVVVVVVCCTYNELLDVDTIQIMHGSVTLKYDEPEVENVARGCGPSATFSTKGCCI